MGCTASVPQENVRVDLTRFNIVDGLPTVSLATICSRLLLDRIAKDPSLPKSGFVDLEKDAAILVIDISGFTVLGQRLSSLGKHGAESLSSTIAKYFGPLVDRLIDYGASVECFGGDAIFALFGSQFATPNERLLRAAECALSICSTLGEFQTTIPIVDVTHTLSSHLGLSFGTFAAMHVGGHRSQFRRVVCGAPIADLDEALNLSGAKEVVVTQGVASRLSSWCTFVDIGPADLGYARLTGWCDANRVPLPPVDYPTAVAFADALDEDGTASHVKTVKRAIAAFLDAQKVAQEADMTAFVAESRRATILFIGLGILPSQSVATPAAAAAVLAVLQEMVGGIQAVLSRYDGRLSNMLADEKGFNVVASFGLPAHEDDPLRGVIAALLIHRNLTQAHAAAVQRGVLTADRYRFPTIGITTGTVMSGRIGSFVRSEDAVIGSPVNLAARLMTYARTHPAREGKATSVDAPTAPPVLMDGDTQRAVEQYPTAPPRAVVGQILLRGFADRVTVYAPDLSADVEDDMSSASFAPFLPQPAHVRPPVALLATDLPSGAVQVGHFVWPPAIKPTKAGSTNGPANASMDNLQEPLTSPARASGGSNPPVLATSSPRGRGSGDAVGARESGPSAGSGLGSMQMAGPSLGTGSLHGGVPTLTHASSFHMGKTRSSSDLQTVRCEDEEGSIANQSFLQDSAFSGGTTHTLSYDAVQSVDLEFYPVVAGKLFARTQVVEELLLAVKGARGAIVHVDALCVITPPSRKSKPAPDPSFDRRRFLTSHRKGQQTPPRSPKATVVLSPHGFSVDETTELMYPRTVSVSLPAFVSVALHPKIGVGAALPGALTATLSSLSLRSSSPSPPRAQHLQGTRPPFQGRALIQWAAAALRCDAVYVIPAVQALARLRLVAYAGSGSRREKNTDAKTAGGGGGSGSEAGGGASSVVITNTSTMYEWTPAAFACAERSDITAETLAGARGAASVLQRRALHRHNRDSHSTIAHDHAAAVSLFAAASPDPYEPTAAHDAEACMPGVSVFMLGGPSGSGKSTIIDMVISEALQRFDGGGGGAGGMYSGGGSGAGGSSGAGGALVATSWLDPHHARSTRWFSWFQILHAGTSAVGAYPTARALLGQALHRILCVDTCAEYADVDALPSSFSYDTVRRVLRRILAARMPHLSSDPSLQALVNEVLELNVFDVPPITSGLMSLHNVQPCFALGLVLAAALLELAERVRPVVVVVDGLHILATRPLDGTAVEVMKASLQQYRNSGIVVLSTARPYNAHPTASFVPNVAVVPVPLFSRNFIKGLLRDVITPLRMQAADNVMEWFLNSVTVDTSPRVVIHAIRAVAARVAKLDVAPLLVVRRRLIMPTHVNTSELSSLATKLQPGVLDAFSREVLSKLDRMHPRVAIVLKAASTFISGFRAGLLEYVIRYAFQSATFPLRFDVDGQTRPGFVVADSYVGQLLPASAQADASLDAIISHLIADKWLVQRSVRLAMADPVVAGVVAASLLASQYRAAAVVTCRVLQRTAVATPPHKDQVASFAWQLSPISFADVHPYTLENPPPLKLRSAMIGAAGADERGYARGFTRSPASAWSPIVSALPLEGIALPTIQAPDGSIRVQADYPSSDFAPMLRCVAPQLWVIGDQFVSGLFEKSIENVSPYGFIGDPTAAATATPTAATSPGGPRSAKLIDGLGVPKLRVISGPLVSEAIRTIHFGYLAAGYLYASNNKVKAMTPMITALCVLLAIDWDDFEAQAAANSFTSMSPDPTVADTVDTAEITAQPECDFFANGQVLVFSRPPSNPRLRRVVDAARLQLLLAISIFSVRMPVVNANAAYALACETMDLAMALKDAFALRIAYGVAFRAGFVHMPSTPLDVAQHLFRTFIAITNTFPDDDASAIIVGYFVVNFASKFGRQDISYALNELCLNRYYKSPVDYDSRCIDDVYELSSIKLKFLLQRSRFAHSAGFYDVSGDTLREHASAFIPREPTGEKLVMAARMIGNLIMAGQWSSLRLLGEAVGAQAAMLSHPFGIRLSAFALRLSDALDLVGHVFDSVAVRDAFRVAAQNNLVAEHVDSDEDEALEVALGGPTGDESLYLKLATNTLGAALGRSLLRLKETFSEFAKISAAVHRIAYFTTFLRLLPIAWLPVPAADPTEADDSTSFSGSDMLRSPVERRSSVHASLLASSSHARHDASYMMAARIGTLTELVGQITPQTFGFAEEIRAFAALYGVTTYMVTHATRDHPRSNAKVVARAVNTADATAAVAELPRGTQILPCGLSTCGGFDPALSLFELTIARDGGADEQPLAGLAPPSVRHVVGADTYTTAWDGPPTSAGAVAAQTLLLLSEVIRSGLPGNDLSQEMWLGMGPFPMLAEWRIPSRLQHHALDALRDLLILAHPTHPLAAAVAAAFASADVITADALQLLPSSTNPATPVNALLQLTGTERIMPLTDALALARRWLEENQPHPDSLVGQYVATLKWCVDAHSAK